MHEKKNKNSMKKIEKKVIRYAMLGDYRELTVHD